MSAAPPHVLIIGAGTGGLCLAHGLRRAGITVAVYERHRDRTDGLLGYRVGIGPTGSRALRECLPPELFATFLATCARPPHYFNVVTQGLRQTASFALRPSADPVRHRTLGGPDGAAPGAADRPGRRGALRQDLHPVRAARRRHGHRATSPTAPAPPATCWSAADGTHSAVRRQYLPHAVTRDAGTINIATRIPLTAHTRDLVPERVRQGISLIFGVGGIMGVLHVMDFKWDAERAIKPGVSDADAALLRQWPGLSDDTTTDNINLIIWSAARRFPADVMERRGEDLVQVALELTANWHPNLRELLTRADPASVLPINVSTSEPVPPWKSSTVTMLGDAIHTMTPGRGVGANTALRDARLLCDSSPGPPPETRRCSRRWRTTRPPWRRTASRGSPNR